MRGPVADLRPGGEILFQTDSCADCGPANCTGCTCVPATGGGDRCNNGPAGKALVCVRAL